MKLNLYDRDLNRIAIIGEQYVSCLWSEGYNTVENFSLEVIATDSYKKKIRPGLYVGRSDRKTLMVIKTAQVIGDKIVCSGKQAALILDDVAFIGTIAAGSVVASSIKTAYDGSTGYLNVGVAESGIKVAYPEQISNKSILELCTEMCQGADVGFRAVRGNGEIVIEFYQPELDENLKFSERFGNISVDSITYSDSVFKNYAIVLGENDSKQIVRQDVDLSGGGERFELIVDSNVTWEESDTTSTYKAKLRANGMEELRARRKTIECAFSPIASEFGKRYDLGDILTVILPDYDFKLQARVVRFNQKAQKNKTETTIEVGQITIVR